MQTKKLLLPIAVIMMMAILTVPSFAWVYHDNPIDDGLYEDFGPRADRLLVNLYATDVAEFDALVAGDIDLTDWPIPKVRYDQWTTSPLNNTIQVVSYGPEYGLFILDMNSNNNQYLGNPPDPAYTNPVYQNPMSVHGMRIAVAYLINRAAYLADPSIGAGFGFPMYTTMPPAQAKYLLDVFAFGEMPWAYTYSPAAANASLDASGFSTFDAEGWRIWNVTGTTVNLKFYIRSDHPGRNMIGTALLNELTAARVKVTPVFGSSSVCAPPVMYQKDFHLYTGGWSLGVDPDHLILWAWDYYWHPGFCYNYGGHYDPIFNDAALGIMYANTQDEAVTQAYAAQYQQAYMVWSVPIYCVAGNKAYHKTYVGPEAPYTGVNWEGVKNIIGYGIDNGYTLSNMHPTGYPTGNGNMTIRWGFKADEIKEWNPIYAQWLFDWNAMFFYSGLLSRNPNDMGAFMPGLARNWTVGTYVHPTLGECTKIRFQMREDAVWADGVKITAGDVYFTFYELKNILNARGFENPWWYSNVADILSFSIIDPCTFEVLLGVKSYWALGWIGGNVVLPQHIWRPIAQTGDPRATAFDPVRMTAASAWKVVAYGGIGSYILYERNENYFDKLPISALVYARGDIISPQKIKPCTPPGNAWFEVVVTNLHATDSLLVDKTIYFTNKTAATKTLIKTVTDITLAPGVPHVETVTLAEIAIALGISLPSWPKCSYDIDVDVTIKTAGPWQNEVKSISFDWWGTMRTDIKGAANYATGVPMPDCIVDFRDIGEAARAFGAAVGTERWNTVADINGDAYIDFRDINPIARDFGKP